MRFECPKCKKKYNVKIHYRLIAFLKIWLDYKKAVKSRKDIEWFYCCNCYNNLLEAIDEVETNEFNKRIQRNDF